MTKGKKTVWGGKATVNDWMMKYIGLPIVWGWLMAALGIVAMGVYEPDAVMPMLEGYIALLAIVGTEQTQEIGTMEDRIAHRHRMEEMEMAHLHRLEQIAATGEYVNKENDKINTQIGMKDKTKSE